MKIGRKQLENSYRFASSREGKTDWKSNLGERKHETMKLTVFRREKRNKGKTKQPK